MLKELFLNQQIYLNHFFDSVDVTKIEALLSKIKSSSGALILSGVGKSGLIAQKIQATLLSTGVQARYLSCSDALHGDIGMVSKGDIFLAFSKSGESEELLNLIPHVQKRGAYTVAILSKINSHLEKISDFTIFLPLLRELCPYDLAPTTSSAIQLIFGDILAIALMKDRKFSLSQFAKNHPAGLLGRKITFRVKDLMLKGPDLPLVKPTDQLIDVLHILSGKRCGCLLVTEDEELKGIFTDGDLRRAIEKEGPRALHRTMDDLMTKSPIAVDSTSYAYEAMRQMEENPSQLITVLPVLEKGKMKGILRMHDILQAGLK